MDTIDLFSDNLINTNENYFKPFKIDKPVRLIELFGGVGSQAMALRNLGVKFEHYKLVEIDKYCIASYNAIHNTDFTTTDIKQLHAKDLEIVNKDQYIYIMTYSFPCQDLSLAGKQKGMHKGDGTRSGLLWEVERLLKECNELPQVLLMENVPEVIGKKNIKDFQQWELFLESKGYQNYVQILNAKDYGIPQNRSRCFMVSLLGNYSYTFPKKQELKLKLKDLLEEKVDEKYYLSKNILDYYIRDNPKQLEKGNGFKFELTNKNDISKTINTRNGSGRTDTYISNDDCLQIKNNTTKGYINAYEGDSVDLDYPKSSNRRGRVGGGVFTNTINQLQYGSSCKKKN